MKTKIFEILLFILVCAFIGVCLGLSCRLA